jgi:AcrR family transcriptional regulator
MPVFWKHGFSDTSLQELERATGVNKSGLYSEFRDKKDLFIHVFRIILRARRREGFSLKNLWVGTTLRHFSNMVLSAGENRRDVFPSTLCESSPFFRRKFLWLWQRTGRACNAFSP